MSALAERDRFRVGLVALVVVALVGAVVLAASRVSWGATTYTALLEHTGGLRVGEEVQVAGVGSGEVTAIELGEKQVRVEFTLDDDVDLGADTTAEVKVATLLGTHYLLVTPGGVGELDDATIPLASTRVPFNLQDVVNEVVPEVDSLDTEVVERSLAEMARTLDAAGGELGPALDGVRRLSGHVAARSDELGELLAATRGVSEQLVDSGGDLVTLMEHADLVLDTIRTRRATIHRLLLDLTELGEQLSGVVEDTAADLAPTLRDLRRVTDLLEKHDDDLGEGIRTLAPSVRYFANASGTGSWLDQFVPGATPDNVECVIERDCG